MKREKSIVIRTVFAVVVVILLIAAVASPVLARYVRNADPWDDGFNPGNDNPEPSVSVDDPDEGTALLENVVFNVGESVYPVYVRVAIVVTWQTEVDGQVIVGWTSPSSENDYELDLNLDKSEDGEKTGWYKNDGDDGDGFYYYLSPVESGKDTAVFINSCKLREDAEVPDGYELNVELIVQTVQAVGYKDETDEDGKYDPTKEIVLAWYDAWRVNFDTIRRLPQ